MGSETADQSNLRFQVELEFVQALGNPNYLNYLGQNGYFKDTAFVNYLKYLMYWTRPEYAKYVKYPVCFTMLECMQSEVFRNEICNVQCARFIEDQMILHWHHYVRRRTRTYTQGMEKAGKDPKMDGSNNQLMNVGSNMG